MNFPYSSDFCNKLSKNFAGKLFNILTNYLSIRWTTSFIFQIASDMQFEESYFLQHFCLNFTMNINKLLVCQVVLYII